MTTTADVRALGYLGLDVADPDAWHHYATALLGMMAVDTDEGGFALRIDDRCARVLVAGATSDAIAFTGWELAGDAELDRAVEVLGDAGHTAVVLDADDCARRHVRRAVAVTDPAGFRTELFTGAATAQLPFASPTGVSGFVTGDLGLGHVVLATPDLDASVAFYTDLLGFRVSDSMPAGDDDVMFLRCNPRHHSLAMYAADEPALHHLMVEAAALDDVGHALERHLESATPVVQGLGRHQGDEMLSFYSESPAGFQVEFGHGGVRVDEATWVTGTMTGPSHWGHHPVTA